MDDLGLGMLKSCLAYMLMLLIAAGIIFVMGYYSGKRIGYKEGLNAKAENNYIMKIDTTYLQK